MSVDASSAAVSSHWRFSAHPLRLRLVAPLRALALALPPDGFSLDLLRASQRWGAPEESEDEAQGQRKMAPILHRPYTHIPSSTPRLSNYLPDNPSLVLLN